MTELTRGQSVALVAVGIVAGAGYWLALVAILGFGMVA